MPSVLLLHELPWCCRRRFAESANVADWSLYKAIPKASENKSGGGGGGGRTRPETRRDEYGGRTAGVFRRGLEADVLGRDDVLGYVNVADAELQTFLSPSSVA